MGLASALFGSRLRIALVALLLVVAGVGAAFAAGVVGTPSVDGVENRFAGVDDSTTTIQTDVHVTNPNPFSANLSGLSVAYTVEMNDVEMATGNKSGVAIGRGRSTIPLETTLDNERIPTWWVSHVRNGEHTTLRVNASVHSSTLGETFSAPEMTRDVDTDLLGAFNSTETREIDANSAVVSDPVLYINETSAEWGESTADRTALNLTFVVHNPKSYPVAISELGYDIGMNDVDVGEGTTRSEYVIPAHSTRTIEAATYIDNDRLDEWWVSHLERNQVTDLRIDFYAKFDAAGTTFTVPLDPLTYEKTFETDIFGTKPATNATDAGDDAAATTTASEGTPTSTTTPATESETTTESDGSLLDTTTAETTSDTPTPTPTTTGPTTSPGTTTDDGLL